MKFTAERTRCTGRRNERIVEYLQHYLFTFDKNRAFPHTSMTVCLIVSFAGDFDLLRPRKQYLTARLMLRCGP